MRHSNLCNLCPLSVDRLGCRLSTWANRLLSRLVLNDDLIFPTNEVEARRQTRRTQRAGRRKERVLNVPQIPTLFSWLFFDQYIMDALQLWLSAVLQFMPLLWSHLTDCNHWSPANRTPYNLLLRSFVHDGDVKSNVFGTIYIFLCLAELCFGQPFFYLL